MKKHSPLLVAFGLLTVSILGAAFGHTVHARAETKLEPFATSEQLAAKGAAVNACIMEQKVPLIGFNMKVVCVRPSAVEWVR